MPTGPTTAQVEGHDLDNFASNDYLGLTWHPGVRAAFARGGGTGSARLITGNRPAHEALEDRLEQVHGRPALLFPSGYHANLALLATVTEPGDVVASDALNHASIIDGLRLGRAERVVIDHDQPGQIPRGARLAVCEGLFSMDGDIVDLRRWTGDHWLAVDEAHAVGALGPGGRGVAAGQGVVPDFIVGTLGKAFGVAGAFVVGPPELRSLLVSAGRAFVFTTGVPEPLAHAALVALDVADDERRARLAQNAARLRQGLRQVGAEVLGHAHVVPVVTGDRTMDVAARLLAAGILAPGIRFPTVPRGRERIRFTVSSEHSPVQVDRCIDAVAQALR